MDLEPHEQLVLEIVREVVGDLVQDGHARLEVQPAGLLGANRALFAISPAEPDACPVSLHCEAPGDLNLSVGRYALLIDVWERDPGKFAEVIRELLVAIVAGAYEEEVRLARDGTAGKGRGTFKLPRGPVTFTYSSLWTLGRRGPWQRIRYSPYA